MATMSFEHLLDILFVPICIQIGALIVGSFLSRLINRYLQSNVNRDSWQYIFVNALKGLPISWCSGVGLYWTINSLSIPETISRLLSYLLFAVIIFTLTRVIARTLSGMIDFYTMRSDQNMPKTSLLNNLINISTVWRITETTEKFMLFLPTYPFQRSRGSLPYRLLPKSNDRVSVITYTEKAERRCNRQTPLTSQHYFLKPSFSINARYLSISFFFR